MWKNNYKICWRLWFSVSRLTVWTYSRKGYKINNLQYNCRKGFRISFRRINIIRDSYNIRSIVLYIIVAELLKMVDIIVNADQGNADIEF